MASLSLVDAVIQHSTNLKFRPSQTRVESTSSQNVAPGEGGRAGVQASKGEGAGMYLCVLGVMYVSMCPWNDFKLPPPPPQGCQ